MFPVSRVFTHFGMLCLSRQPAEPESAIPSIDFVYFRDANCSRCQEWEATNLPKLNASTLFQQVRFTQITKGLYPFAPSSAFPGEISHLQALIAEKIKVDQSPLFAVLVDGAVVASWTGMAKSFEGILAIVGLQQKQLICDGPVR